VIVRLFKLPHYPNRIAVSDTDSFITDGAFFLDFSRPIEVRRWLGFRNRWVGLAVGVLVPVIHQGEKSGAYVVGVHRNDLYFKDLRRYWKAQYPSKTVPPTPPMDGLKIIADFAAQFPNDC
jgi:hypothetical protein